ncbi:MAG: biotin/lipoyl-containing protein, partial [Terriglobales bacterium]
MATEFKLPELGENIESGDLVRLLIQPGASIAEGEPVMELETDKAVVEVPSSVTGTVGEVRVKEGDKLRVGQVIFTVENGAGSAKAAASPEVANPIGTQVTSRVTDQITSEDRPSQTADKTVSEVPKTVPSAPIQPASPATNRRSSDAPAPTEFKLPELGENIDSGDLVRLMISPGARVAEGQPVMELETDKAVVEVPSSVSGVVRDVKVKEGQKVKVGQVIFTLEGGAAAPVEAPRRHAPVEHISGQQAARLAFQLAMKAEGKTEEQALPPDFPQEAQPQTAPPEFSMPVQLGKVAGTEHRDPVPAAPHV